MTRSTLGIILIVTLLFVLVNVAVAADTVAITARQAVVRAGPGSKQRILATLPQGTTLALLETRQGWYKVLLDDGQEGWVAQSAAQEQRGLLRQDAPAPQVSASHPGIYRQSWAVIVGVNRFRDTRIAPLSYATNDAQAVARALEPLGFPASNVTVLRDTQATKGEIECVLSSVVRRATAPEDRLFLFFATHGMTVPLPGGGEDRVSPLPRYRPDRPPVYGAQYECAQADRPAHTSASYLGGRRRLLWWL